MANIRHYLIIEATPKKFYEAITTERGIKIWWTIQTNAKPTIGNINVQRFGEEYFNKMKVVDLVEHTRVEWECVDGDKEWVGTNIMFKLGSREDITMLLFSHLNWKDESEFYGFCNHHWGHFLDSLKMNYETEKGNPFTS